MRAKGPATMKSIALLSLCLGLALSSAHAQHTIFLVRHAEKAAGDSKDPDLSESGRARAERLASMLRDANISEIFVTEFKRTQETAAPLARAGAIKITTIPAGQGAELLEKLKTGTENALVIGHGNTLPDLMKALGIETAVHIAETDYDNLFVVVMDEKPRLLRLHF